MHCLDVANTETGKIWQRKPVPSSDDGLLVTISHNTDGSAFSTHNRLVRFVQLSWDPNGERLLAGDHFGNIYCFDTVKNKYDLLQRTGSACTALAFGLRRRTEYLVAMSDNSLKCFDTDTKELVSMMKGHESAIHSVSVHGSGRYALTTSNDISLLWELDTFTRKRKLNVRENVGIIKVFFLPLSNVIMTCFKDDSIFAWEADTLQCKYQLPLPADTKPMYKAFATSRDGRYLVGGGKSQFLHVWTLDSKKLLRIIQLPDKVRIVKSLQFLPNKFDGGTSQIIGVLCQDGLERFINIHTCKLVFDIGDNNEHRITQSRISSNGKYISAIHDNGSINIYSVAALTAELNRPPPPLVKIMNNDSDRKSRDDSGSTRSSARSRGSSGSGKRSICSRRSNNSNRDQTLADGIDKTRLMAILKGYGEFPAKYRMFIWRNLLKLPENHEAFSSLVDKGTHSSYSRIYEQYPIKSRRLLRVLQRTLSALAHWSPIFGETQFLPFLTFPFIKLIQNNQLVCFEVIATVLVNWCQSWFEFFPNPPINMLAMIENMLAHHDKDLLDHLVDNKVTSQMYAWPLFETLFSEVVTKEDWLILFDHVLANHPAYFSCCVVSYLLCVRQPLLQIHTSDDFEYFFHNRNSIPMSAIVNEAYRVMETTPDPIHPSNTMAEFTPLTKAQYPVFNKYPKFVVDYQIQERERIRQEELDYLRQRQVAELLKQETEKKVVEEEAWYRQQELILDAEEQRRKLMLQEEQKLVDQRVRLQAMKREVRVREQQLLDAARRKFMKHQQLQKGAELKRLDDEIERKGIQREQETQAAIEDVEIKNMELIAQKSWLQQELGRVDFNQSQKVNMDLAARRKQQELEDQLRRKISDIDGEMEMDMRKEIQAQLAKAELKESNIELKSEIGYRHRLEDVEAELGNLRLSLLNNGNRNTEVEINQLLMQMKQAKEKSVGSQMLNLGDQHQLAQKAEERRLKDLHNEANKAKKHAAELHKSLNDSFERLRQDGTMAPPADSRCLNDDKPSSPIPVSLDLDRGRRTFERKELELLAQVRDLRKRVATEGRNKHPPLKMNLSQNSDI